MSTEIAFVLIFWFYMHLWEQDGLVRLAAMTGAVALAILLGLVSTDYLARSWPKNPGPS